MQSIRPRIIYSGHGPPVTNPMARLEFLIDHRLKREHELINLLSISEMSIDRLCEAMYKGIDLTLPQGLALEADLNVLLQSTKDRKEGIDSFLQKRKPIYIGD